MINAIPIVGWLLSAIFSFSLAVPFWFFWTFCGLGAAYFYWLPPVYHEIPFWHSYGLFVLISILKTMVPKLTSTNIPNYETK